MHKGIKFCDMSTGSSALAGTRVVLRTTAVKSAELSCIFLVLIEFARTGLPTVEADGKP